MTTETRETNTKLKTPLKHFYDISNDFEIGVDEAGRGPLFGRLYVSAVILPANVPSLTTALPKVAEKELDFSAIKDSKKIKNKKTIKAVSEFIKTHAIAYSVKYVEHDIIDHINIRESVLQSMHQCIDEVLQQIGNSKNTTLLIDGNDFRPYMVYDDETGTLTEVPSVCIEQGDNLYYSIAAASILAKVARDEYILELCNQYPELVEKYHLDTNMGYGTKQHIEGIKEYGITQWHRKTYGICRGQSVYTVI